MSRALGISPYVVPFLQASTMESQPECDGNQTTKSTEHGVLPQRGCFNIMSQPHSQLYQTPDESRRHSYRCQSVKGTCAPDNDGISAEEASAERQDLPKPILNETEGRYQKSNLDEIPLEAYEAQLTETIGNYVIEHATFANAGRSPGEAKDKPHGGEHASGSEKNQINEEQVIPDKPAYEDAGEGSTDQGLNQPQPERCSSPSSGGVLMVNGVVGATPTFKEFSIKRCMDTMSMEAHLQPQHFFRKFRLCHRVTAAR